VDVESLEIAVVSALVVKGEQKVLWNDESEHWSERRLFIKLRSELMGVGSGGRGAGLPQIFSFF